MASDGTVAAAEQATECRLEGGQQILRIWGSHLYEMVFVEVTDYRALGRPAARYGLDMAAAGQLLEGLGVAILNAAPERGSLATADDTVQLAGGS